MATLKEIAEIAQVNISTVSKALRNSSDLNEKTISTIQGIADELHYAYRQKNAGKSRQAEKLVGVIVPEVISSYYMMVLESLRTRLQKENIRMQFMISGFSPAEELRCVRQALKANACAVVCFSEQAEQSPDLLKLIQTHPHISFLLLSPADHLDVCDSIRIADFTGADMAMQHLLSLGHRKIAYVGDTLSKTRRRAYAHAMSAAGLPADANYICEEHLRFEECGYRAMQRLLQLSDPPTAVFAAYDNVAIGIMSAAYEAGLSIPRDLSIISIDDISTAKYLHPPLTTVTEFTNDLGKLAGDMLMMRLENKCRAIQNLKLRPSLNIRGTTAPPAPRP